MSESGLTSSELGKETMRLIYSMESLSRIDLLNRIEAMANKWDDWIKAKKGPGCATFAETFRGMEAYFHEQGLDLDEIPGGMIKEIPPETNETDDCVPF